jgi:hypothetical protein
VQTFRTDASTGTVVPATNAVGGAVPSGQGSGANTNPEADRLSRLRGEQP